MKLLFCKHCHDIIKLTMKKRYCECKRVNGKYIDTLNAEFFGKEAVLLGIDNHSFVKQLKKDKTKKSKNFDLENFILNSNNNFTAFVIDEPCKTFKRKQNMSNLVVSQISFISHYDVVSSMSDEFCESFISEFPYDIGDKDDNQTVTMIPVNEYISLAETTIDDMDIDGDDPEIEQFMEILDNLRNLDENIHINLNS